MAVKLIRITDEDHAVVAIPAGWVIYVMGDITRLIEPLAHEERLELVTKLSFAEDSLLVLEGYEPRRWLASRVLFARLDRWREERMTLDPKGTPNFDRHRRAALLLDGPPDYVIEDGIRHALLYRDEELIAAGPRGHGETHGWLMRRESDRANPGDTIAYVATSLDDAAPESGEFAYTETSVAA